MMSNQSTPPSKIEYATEKIKQMLFSGEFQTGDKLPSETKLAAKLNVSRSMIREALRQLDEAGYVKIIPNRGAFTVATSEDVTPTPRSWLEINADKVSELLDVRNCIEPFAAALCAQNISKEGLKKLKEQIEGFEEALDTHDWTTLAQYDLEFHRTILNESRNRYFIQMYRPLLESFMQYSRRSFAATYSQSNTHSEHLAIYNAIAVHSPEEAHMAMQLHITIAKRRMKFKED